MKFNQKCHRHRWEDETKLRNRTSNPLWTNCRLPTAECRRGKQSTPIYILIVGFPLFTIYVTCLNDHFHRCHGVDLVVVTASRYKIPFGIALFKNTTAENVRFVDSLPFVLSILRIGFARRDVGCEGSKTALLDIARRRSNVGTTFKCKHTLVLSSVFEADRFCFDIVFWGNSISISVTWNNFYVSFSINLVTNINTYIKCLKCWKEIKYFLFLLLGIL